jgi:hypothetical protein
MPARVQRDTPVAVSLSADMTPEDVAEAVAAELALAGFAFDVSGSEVTFDDAYGDIDSISVEYSTTGSTPTVNWLTETIGFQEF